MLWSVHRQCLQDLILFQFPLVIQTKSSLVQRDIDLFQRFNDIEVGLSITTNDEHIAKLFEPGASSIHERITSLGVLRE